jgi:hypothetical protein
MVWLGGALIKIRLPPRFVIPDVAVIGKLTRQLRQPVKEILTKKGE